MKQTRKKEKKKSMVADDFFSSFIHINRMNLKNHIHPNISNEK
jgi:hypothetical protein